MISKKISYFGMGVLLYICCIFSEHLFLRTPLDGCFWRRLIIRGFFYNVNVMSGKYLCNNPFVNYLLIFNFCLFAPPKIFICLWEKISSVAEILYLSLSHFFSFLKKSFFSLFVYRSTFFVTILKARKFSLEDHLTFWFYGFRLHHNSLI